jgi:hypothetical protein
MSEKDLGKALLNGENSIDLAALTRSVLQRDRRRVVALSIICVIAWMMVVMLPWATILPMLSKIMTHQQQMPGGETMLGEDPGEKPLSLMQVVKQGTMATFFGSIASMFIAAICTVTLIVVSRRATLRQVNARLAEISAQLKIIAAAPK